MRSRAQVARTKSEATSSNDGFFPPEEKPTAPSVTDVFEKAAAAFEKAAAAVTPSQGAAADEESYPRMAGGFDRIVERLYNIDSDSEEQDLERKLKLSMKASRADYPMIVDALDEAEDCARRAMALYVNGKVSHAAFEMDSLAITGAMRKEAVAALEANKLDADGKPIKGTKMITEADVTGYLASQWADQWRRIELDREKSKQMVAYLERLAELWKQRARDLQVMAQNARQ